MKIEIRLIGRLTEYWESGKLLDIAEGATKVIMSPYANMSTTIALSAWNYLDAFDEFDEDRIKDFIRAHVNSNNAPEPFAR